MPRNGSVHPAVHRPGQRDYDATLQDSIRSLRYPVPVGA